jgi:hypothetical protein
MHDKYSRAVLVGQRWQRTQCCQGLAGAGARGIVVGCGTGEANPVGDIPDGDPPVLFAGNAQDLAFGLIRFACFDPDAGERGVDVVGQSGCQAPSWISCCSWAVFS